MKAEGNENDSIFLCRKAVLSPIKELDELEVLERHTSLDRDSGSSNTEVRVAKTVADLTFPGPVVSDDCRKSWSLSQRNHTSDAPPIWILSSPRFPVLPTGKRERQVDIPVTPRRKEVKHSSLASPDHVPEPPRIVVPAFPRITLPRFSLSPSGIDKVLGRRLAMSEPGNNLGNTEVGSAAPDPLLDAQRSQTTRLDSLSEDCGSPTAVLRSRLKGINIDSEAGTSPSRTTLGSLPSRLHTSVD